MVMKKDMMRRNTRRTIMQSVGRYIAIVTIIALGAGMFVGLLSTKKDMVATAQKFTDEMAMFDLRLLNSYGWDAEDVEQVAQMSGVTEAEGSVSMDALGAFGDSEETLVYRLHSIPERVNKVMLLGGRMPEKPDECLVDGSHADDSVLGTTFTVASENEEALLDSLSATSFTVVGYISTPLYMDMSRGSTSLGNGSLSNYIYIPAEGFRVDYFTEIGVTIAGDHEVYSEAYNEALEEMADRIEPGAISLAQSRYEALKGDAQAEVDKGLEEYEEGLSGYESTKQETLDALAQGLKELEEAQTQIDAGWEEIESAKTQIQQAQKELDEEADRLSRSERELAEQILQTEQTFTDTEESLLSGQEEASAGLAEVQAGMTELEAGLIQIEEGLLEIDEGIRQLDQILAILPPQSQSAKDYQAQRMELEEKKASLLSQRSELEARRSELEQTEKTLLDTLFSIEQGFEDLAEAREQAQIRFDTAQAQIEVGKLQLDQGNHELDASQIALEDSELELREAQEELDRTMEGYENDLLDAQTGFAEAEAELAQGKQELEEAQQAVDELLPPQVHVLDRNTNVGYLAVDSNSDIVAGVSRVFPAFFLLVAALVCITTMTRMVDEERTQIGILKALGYSDRAIAGKYLFYSGSAAVLGCGIGVLVGSVVFPKILWCAYRIILNLTPDIVLELDWLLCIAVVTAYTAVSMLVTWYCCRKELEGVPAELIRPKAPTPGKKILLERLPFWDKIGFLDKVMFRNVFRYRQRLFMMLAGVGGCTALLLTGFGIGDSIKNIVTYQYEDVTVYDIQVYFSEAQSEEEQSMFTSLSDVERVTFYHQSSVDIQYRDKTREVKLLSGGDALSEHIDLHQDGQTLPMPGPGEAYLSIGVAEAMGIRAGDTVTVRDAELRTMELTVSGIFDNHVYNYLILRPETIQTHWGELPQCQMAYINVGEGCDPYSVGAQISGFEDVMNVSISQDIADQVASMLEAMDLIVLTVVVCAGLLAGIVLYNLTNISINERVREIATIKVLGFTSRETAAYVFKENLFLSALGTVVGLAGGIFLLRFVMSQIKIDMVWFQTRLTPQSFLLSVLLTMLSACFVDFLLYFKLEKVHMAEALKSVE